MKKMTYENVDLICMGQHDAKLEVGQTIYATVTRQSVGEFKLEKTNRGTKKHRLDHVFDGKLCSLTHRTDGKYQVNMRLIDGQKVEDVEALALAMYGEIREALEVLA